MRFRLLLIPDVEGLLRLRLHLFGPADADAMSLETDPGARHDRGAVGELARGAEIFLQRLRAEEQHVARVGEAFAAAAVGSELPAEAKVDSREVAHRGVILGIREPAHRHRTRVAGLRVCGIIKSGVDPGEQGVFLLRTERLRLGGRHVAFADRILDLLPKNELRADPGVCVQLLQIDVALGFFLPVTLIAAVLQQRLDRLPVRAGVQRGG